MRKAASSDTVPPRYAGAYELFRTMVRAHRAYPYIVVYLIREHGVNAAEYIFATRFDWSHDEGFETSSVCFSYNISAVCELIRAEQAINEAGGEGL